MANHGYGTLKKKITVEKLDGILRQINMMRFKNVFSISYGFESDGDCIWTVEYKDGSWKKSGLRFFQIWLEMGGRKIVWPHASSGFRWWLQETFAQEATKVFGGIVSDDGCEGSWEPEFAKKYPTLKDWMVHSIEAIVKDKKGYEEVMIQVYNDEMKWIPKDVKEAIA